MQSQRIPRIRPTVPLRQTVLFALILAGAAIARVGAATTPSGADLIGRAEERFRAIHDYQCAVEVESDLGKQVEAGAAQMWYKQPGMLRVNIIKGKKKGCVVAVDGSGRIRAHKGGLLSGFVRSMKPTDKRLQTIRGASLLTLDWGSFYRKFHEDSARPGARVEVEPRAGATAPYQVCVCFPKEGKPVREVFSIDSRDWVMVEGSLYEGEARVEHVLFRDVKLDTGVKENWFQL